MIGLALLLLQGAPAAVQTEAPQAIVIAGIPEKREAIGLEQDLHPGSTDIYFGAIYEVRFSHPQIVNKTTQRWSVTRRRIRLIGHALNWSRPMLLVVELSSEEPVVTWWNWADKRVCIPNYVVTRYNLSRSMKRGRLQADGGFCLRP